MDLTISIVSYNSRRVIEPCLASVLESATDVRAEIVVVDNAELRLPRDLLVRLPPDGVFWRVAPVRDDGQAGRFIRSGVIRRTASGDPAEARESPADVESHRTAWPRRP